MPRGTRKRGEFDFTIWYEDGSRVQWKSTRSQSNEDIADAIRRYLLPVANRHTKLMGGGDSQVTFKIDHPPSGR